MRQMLKTELKGTSAYGYRFLPAATAHLYK